MYLYFLPQTGVVKQTPIRSENYWVYRVREAHRKKLEEGVAGAKLVDSILRYPDEFLGWLHTVDTKWDQHSGLER